MTTHLLKVTPEATEALKRFQMPAEIGFGSTIAPVMVVCDYDRGTWSELMMVPYGPISLSPTAKVLHYAQEIFEGMKAYNFEGKGARLFRPEENMIRFNLSADRMAMPRVPEDIFMTAVKEITKACKDIIPRRTGESLYIRPFMFASEENLGIKPAEKFKFMVVASPSGSYFSTGCLDILIERSKVRACPGGVGAAKTGGNYAASLKSVIEAQRAGYHQVLWLDALNHERIEELSGMNFFAVIGGELHTPALTNTILHGITRKSILELAQIEGLKVVERAINIDELVNDIRSGRCSEAFACGTAAIITPIGSFGEDNGTRYKVQNDFGPVAKMLREKLLGIQEGRVVGPDGWSQQIH